MPFSGTSPSACTPACSDRPTCTNCTGGLCMWCKNLDMCIDRNAYLASFPYGQCMDWTTKGEECPLTPNKNDSKVSMVQGGERVTTFVLYPYISGEGLPLF